MKKNIITYKINTLYKSIEDFKESFNNYKQEILNDIENKLDNILDLDISLIKLNDNHRVYIEINYLENTKLYKPLFFNLSYKLSDNNSKYVSILLNEIINKYIIIITSKIEKEIIMKENKLLKKECDDLKTKLRLTQKKKKKLKKITARRKKRRKRIKNVYKNFIIMKKNKEENIRKSKKKIENKEPLIEIARQIVGNERNKELNNLLDKRISIIEHKYLNEIQNNYFKNEKENNNILKKKQEKEEKRKNKKKQEKTTKKKK